MKCSKTEIPIFQITNNKIHETEKNSEMLKFELILKTEPLVCVGNGD